MPLAVIDGVRAPLFFRAASIPAFGRLAAVSRKRYGKRADHSHAARHDVFEELQRCLPADVHFKTDGHQQYPSLIKRYFPNGTHTVHISDGAAL